jgi:Protein of unknown function (DUF2442)
MKSKALGENISNVEVTNILKHGFWLLLSDRELFLSFDEFPWFKGAPVSAILNVELPQPHYLYWPDLDVDLAVESIEHPEKFPLIAKPNS